MKDIIKSKEQLRTVNQQLIVNEEKIKHLNRVLRAISNVNRLFIKEKDRDTLIRKACECLIETRGYFNAWIVLLDSSGKFITSAESGLDKDLLPMIELFKKGKLTACGKKALKSSNVIITKIPLEECGDCPLSGSYANRSGMTMRLKHEGKIYGLCSVSIPQKLINEKEEQNLFKEVTSNLSFALHSLEIEKKHKQAEEKLKASEEKLRLMIDNLPIGFSSTDLKGNFLKVNRAMCEMIGYSEQELINNGFDQFTHPDDILKNEEKYRKLVSGKISYFDLEKRYIHKNGNTIYVLIRSQLVRDKDDKPFFEFALIENITERKQTEKKLQTSDFRLNMVCQASDIVVWDWNLVTNKLEWGDSYYRVFGYSKDDTLPTIESWSSFIHPDDVENTLDGINKVINSDDGLKWEAEYRFSKKDGAYIFTLDWGFIIRDKNGKAVRMIGVMMDITKSKQAEEEIVISKERLKMLNKIIRHDLSNDFAVINSAVHIFKNNSDITMLDEIERRIKKSLNTIKNYKKYEAFIDSNTDLEEIKINEVVNELIAEFPDVKINIEGKCKVFADDALYSIFKNLISNSIQHGNSSKVDIKITSNENICKIKFMDNGTGIPDKIKNKIFDEGFIYGKSGHTGIGLHIVKKTIKSYDEYVSVEDNEPNGAVFVINLRKVIK